MRRNLCTNWKTEKDPVRKEDLERLYLEQKQNVNYLMDHLESEEVQKMIDKKGREGINFWKTMKRIKKKPPTFDKIRMKEEKLLAMSQKYLTKKENTFRNYSLNQTKPSKNQ